MIRWLFVVLLASAAFSYFTPSAFACGDHGDSTSGHNAIAFCCEGNSGDRDKGGRGKDARVVVNHFGR